MADYLTTDTELTSVANAIRTKGGTSAQLVYPTGFVSAINDIPTGGGSNKVLVCENVTMQRYGIQTGGVCIGVPFEFDLGTYEFDMLASGFEDSEGYTLLNTNRYDEHGNYSNVFEFAFTVTVKQVQTDYIGVEITNIVSDMNNVFSDERQFYFVLGSADFNVGSDFGGMPYAIGFSDFSIDALIYNDGLGAYDYALLGNGSQMTCVSLYVTKIQ